MASRAVIEPRLLEFSVLSEEHSSAAAAFSCGDSDLDDFLRSDASRYQAHHVTTTYVAFYEGSLVGYVALLADAVVLNDGERRKLKAPNSTPLGHSDHPVIPAVKIARLAVSKDFRERVGGCGQALVRFACWRALDAAETIGCRLVTVDAYPDAVLFYERIGFTHNRAKEYRERKQPSMRFDIFADETQAWILA